MQLSMISASPTTYSSFIVSKGDVETVTTSIVKRNGNRQIMEITIPKDWGMVVVDDEPIYDYKIEHIWLTLFVNHDEKEVYVMYEDYPRTVGGE